MSDPATQKVPDLLGRDFTADLPNATYVGDITYLPLATGATLYLATVIDCYFRRVTGSAIAEHMRIELIADALRAADTVRGGLAGAVFHSDYGSHHTPREFANLCATLGVTQSMSGVGTSADNALADRSTLPSNAKCCATTAAGPTPRPAAAKCSGG